MKLTPWFPGTVKPVRKGVYQRHIPDENMVLWAKWDGEKWMRAMLFQHQAYSQVIESIHARLPWRGVAK